MKDVTYDNIKSHIFGYTTGGVKLTPPSPLPPSRFRVKTKKHLINYIFKYIST